MLRQKSVEQPNLPENIDLGFKHYRLATPTVQTLEQIELLTQASKTYLPMCCNPFQQLH